MTRLDCYSLIFIASFALPLSVRAHEPPTETIDALSRRIAATPSDADLYWQRGELQRLEGNLGAAASDLDQAARLDPTIHEVELSRAFVLHAIGEPEQARGAVTAFLAHEHEHAGAVALHARILSELGERRAAIAEISRAIELGAPPSPELYLQRAEWMAGLEPTSLDEAILGLEEGRQRLGPLVTLELRAVDLEVQCGRHDAALVRLERLSAQFDRKESIHVRRGDVLAAAGRTFEAQVAYTEALDAIASLSPSRRTSQSVRDLEDHVRSRLVATPPNEKGAPQ